MSVDCVAKCTLRKIHKESSICECCILANNAALDGRVGVAGVSALRGDPRMHIQRLEGGGQTCMSVARLVGDFPCARRSRSR